MQKLVKEYLEELNRRQKKGRKIAVAVMLLVVMVVGTVASVLTQYGMAMSGKPTCGLEEHTHSDECYTKTLVCQLEEGHVHTAECKGERQLVCELEEGEEHTHTDSCYVQPEEYLCGQEEGHVHGDGCYTKELTCGKEEHTHVDLCYIAPDTGAADTQNRNTEAIGEAGTEAAAGDTQNSTEEAVNGTETGEALEPKPDADDVKPDANGQNPNMEDPATWDAQYADVAWTGDWGQDLVTAAGVQVGYEESQDNYEVAEDGSHDGYTRYGQFAGDSYADWDAAFVNFCIHYAGLEESLFPKTVDGDKWQEEFKAINENNSTYLTEAAGYTPELGDIVFMESENGEAEAAEGTEAAESASENKETEAAEGTEAVKAAPVQIGIVSGYDEKTGEVIAIEGDSGDSVKENRYKAEDGKLKSYLKIGELEAASKSGGDIPQDGEQPILGTSENTRINAFNITGMITGSAPFDSLPDHNTQDEKERAKLTEYEAKGYIPGDDLDAYDKYVRTFDTVQYGFHIEMASVSPKDRFQKACVLLKFVLPASEEEAEFDLDSMSWLKPLSEDTLVPAIEGERQTLIGKVTLESDRYVVPGSYRNTVAVKIKNKQDGTTLEPQFYAAMGNADGTEDLDHVNWGNPVPAGEVTVSAASKYNVYVNGDVANIREEFDFDKEGTSEQAPNREMGKIAGNVLKVGVALQLYNDYPSKGMKGIQLPQQGSEISFQLNLAALYTLDKDSSVYPEEKDYEWFMGAYGPLLWSVDGSGNCDGFGGADQYGRTLNDLHWCRTLVPDNSGEGDNACYQGGTWSAVQDASRKIVTVTVKDWEINTEKMPKKNGYGSEDVYEANMGCFSAGEFIFIQPFNQKGSSSTAPNYDIVNWPGEGIFQTSVITDGSLTVDGKPCSSENEGYKSVVRSIGLKKPGNMTNRIGFLEPGERWLSPGYTAEMEPDGHFGHGDGFVLAGDKIEIAGGITYGRGDYGRMQFGTNLMKFDGEKLQPTGKTRDTFGNEPHNKATLDTGDGPKGMKLGENTFVFYAAKKDGGNWINKEEMQTCYEDKLLFYKNMDDLLADGKICVGILTCFKGLGSAEYINAIYQVAHEVEVVKKDENIGETCEVISTSRVWAEEIRVAVDDVWTWVDHNHTSYYRKWEKIDYRQIEFETARYFQGLPQELRTPYYANATSDYQRYKAHYRNGSIVGRSSSNPETHDNMETEVAGANGDYWEGVGHFYTGTVYGEDGGIQTTHLSDGMDTGDTVLILGYKAGITKSLMQQVENAEGVKEEKTRFDLNQDQRVVDYKLQPSIKIDEPGTGKTGQTTDITIVDTLDKDMEYVSGSAYLGGDYEQASPQGGTKGEILEGVQTEPVVSLSGNGCQVLTWTIENVNIADARNGMEPIYYSAKIKNSICNTMGTVTERAVKNEVHIFSTDDKREQTLKNGNYAEEDITVQLANQTSHGKIVDQEIVEENGQIDYTVYYNNFDTNSSGKSALIVDTMPRNAVKKGEEESKFDGTYTMSGWKLDEDSKKEGIRIFYVPESSLHTTDLPDTTIPESELANYNWAAKGWTEAGVNTTTGEIQFDGTPAVWAAYGTLEFGESLRVNLSIDLQCGTLKTASNETNKLVNYVESVEGSGGMEVTTKTVRRSLEGLAWLDYNHDGLQDDNETLMCGVRVQLLQLKVGSEENPEYESVMYENDADREVEIQTGQQVSIRSAVTKGDYELKEGEIEENGYYRFMDLPPGTYAVRFILPKDSQTHKATKVNAGDDTRDSDAEPTYHKDENGNETETLEYTQISNLVMPDVKEIEANGGSAVYRLEHNDSGFYPNPRLEIQKTDENGSALTGASFIIKEGSEGKAVSFMKNGDGIYTMSDPDTGGQPDSSEPEKFVIALSGVENQVMGVRGDQIFWQEKIDDPEKEFEIDSSQLFEIYDVGDDYQAIKSVAGKWMGLEEETEGKIPAVKMLDNPDENSENPPTDPRFHWKMDKWQDGGRDIIPKTKPGYSIGIGNSGLIQLSSNKNQQFLVIPAAKHNETTELKVDGNGKLIIKNLMSGTSYTIEEIKAPDGYRILSSTGKISVSGEGEITLMEDSNGNISHQEGSEDGNAVLKLNIRNNKLYELPSTGGVGIYWYSIGGILLMLAGSLILYKNKCKEVWGS